MRVVQMMRKVEMLLHHFGLGCMGAIVIYPTRATGVFPRPPGGARAWVRARARVCAGVRVRAWVRAFHPWPPTVPAFGLI